MTNDQATLKFKGAIFDIDGVLEYQGSAYPGAVELLNELRSTGVVIRFLTNSTLKSRNSAVKKLRIKGFHATEDEMFTASFASAEYLRQVNAKSCWIMQAGEGAEEFLEFNHNDEAPEYIVVGDYRDGFNFYNLNKALRLIINGSKLVGMSEELIDHSLGNLELNVGSWVRMLETASGVKATYIGKPSPFGFELALQTMGLPKEQVLMVGDQVKSDIEGAQGVGLKGVLIKTGEFRPSHLESGIQPDFCFDSINEIRKLFLS